MDIDRLKNIFIQIINNVKESDEKNIDSLLLIPLNILKKMILRRING